MPLCNSARSEEPLACLSGRTSTASTLPTPSHVSLPSDDRSVATVMTTPRVPVNASWQRLTSAGSGSPAWRSRTPAAVFATAVASLPWPRPSTTANSTPSARGLTKCTSPQMDWPGNSRHATPQEISDRDMSVSFSISAQPLLHRDGRSDADLGLDVEFIHQPFCSRQPDAQAFAGRKAVLHGLRDVRDPGAVIAGDDAQAMSGAVIFAAENDFPALGVFDYVARNLGDGGGDERHLCAIETQFSRQGANVLTRHHNVLRGGNRHPCFTCHGGSPSWSARRDRLGLPRGPGPCRCLRASSPTAPS